MGKSCLVVRFVRDEFFEYQEPTIGGKRRRGGDSFVACLSHLAVDHLSLSMWSTVPSANKGTKNVKALFTSQVKFFFPDTCIGNLAAHGSDSSSASSGTTRLSTHHQYAYTSRSQKTPPLCRSALQNTFLRQQFPSAIAVQLSAPSWVRVRVGVHRGGAGGGGSAVTSRNRCKDFRKGAPRSRKV